MVIWTTTPGRSRRTWPSASTGLRIYLARAGDDRYGGQRTSGRLCRKPGIEITASEKTFRGSDLEGGRVPSSLYGLELPVDPG